MAILTVVHLARFCRYGKTMDRLIALAQPHGYLDITPEWCQKYCFQISWFWMSQELLTPRQLAIFRRLDRLAAQRSYREYTKISISPEWEIDHIAITRQYLLTIARAFGQLYSRINDKWDIHIKAKAACDQAYANHIVHDKFDARDAHFETLKRYMNLRDIRDKTWFDYLKEKRGNLKKTNNE